MAPPREPEPTSWAEACQQYRAATRGPALAPMEPAVSYGRTRMAKFADPVYSVGAEPYKPHPVGPVEMDRFKRHGWGNYASEQKVRGDLPPEPFWSQHEKRPIVATASIATAGETIRMRNPGGPNDDRWLGNMLIDPSKGRKHAVPSDVAAGRDSFFDIVNQRGLDGVRVGPEKDSWLGHRLVDPTKGKGYVPDPAVVKEGRRDLFKVITHTDTPSGGPGDADPARLDSWIGHVKIDPHKGRSSDGTLAQTQRLASRSIPISSLVKMEPGPLPALDRSIRMSSAKYADAGVRACVQWVPPTNSAGRGAGRRQYPQPAVAHHQWPDRSDFSFHLEGQVGRAAKQKVYPVPGTTVVKARSAKLRSEQFYSAQGEKQFKML